MPSSIDLSDFDQFKTFMQNLVAKLDGFKPGELQLLEMQQRSAANRVTELESTLSKLETKDRYVQTLIEIDQLQQENKPENSPSINEKTANANYLLNLLSPLTKDRVLDGKTLSQAQTEFQNALRQNQASYTKALEERGKLAQKIQDLRQKLRQPLQTLNERRATITQQLSALSDTPTREQKQALYRSFGVLVDKMPDQFYRRTLTQLDINIRAGLLNRIAQNIQQQLRQQLQGPLGTAGNKEGLTVNLNLGAEFSVLALMPPNVALSGEFSYSVSVGNDRRIVVNKSKVLSLSGGLGNDDSPGQVKLKGDLQSGQIRVFNNLDDFINEEANQNSRAFLEYSLSKNPLHLNASVDYGPQYRAINLRETARLNEHDLNKHARLLGLVNSDASLAVPQKPQVSSLTTNFRGIAGSTEGSFQVASAINLGIGRRDELLKKLDTRTVNFLDNLQARGALPHIYAQAQPRYVRFTTGSSEGDTYHGLRGVEIMDLMRNQLPFLKLQLKGSSQKRVRAKIGLEEIRWRLKTALTNLEQEYTEFAQLAKRKDAEGAPGEVGQRLERLKNDRGIVPHPQLFKGASVGSRAEYLKAVSIQYAQLVGLYNESFPENVSPVISDDSEFSDFLDAFKRDLKDPPFYIPQADLDKVFNAKQIAKGTEINQSFSFTVGSDLIPHIGESFSVQVLHNTIQNTSNEYNEGQAMSITAQLSGSVGLQDAIKAIIQTLNSKGYAIDESVVENAIGNEQIRLVPDLEAGYGGTLELSFVNKEDFVDRDSARGKIFPYKLMYARLSDERTLGVGGNIPIDTGHGVTLNIGASVANTHTRNRWEFMGDDTLHYVRDIYTGLHLGEQADRWESFKNDNRSLVDSFFKRLFLKLSDPDSSIAREMGAELDLIGDSALKSQWDRAIDAYGKDAVNSTKQDRVMDLFDRVMAKRFEKFKEECNRRFVNRLRTKDLKTYSEAQLSRAVQEFVRRYKVPTTVQRDIPDLLEWAKNEYENNATDPDAAFNMLRHAYGLDDASHFLTDLVQSKDYTERKGTLLQWLDDGVEGMLENPKIYLEAGIRGKLVQRFDVKGYAYLDVEFDDGVKRTDKVRELIGQKLDRAEGSPSSDLPSRLPDNIRAVMEHRFQGDFSKVQILEGTNQPHIDGETATIYFEKGTYNARSKEGIKLVGRKLADLVKARDGASGQPDNDSLKSILEGIDRDVDRGIFREKPLGKTKGSMNRRMSRRNILRSVVDEREKRRQQGKERTVRRP